MDSSVFVARASFIRPANTTAYAAGDLVANDPTAASVVPLAFDTGLARAGMMVRRVRVTKSGAALTNAAFRLHLFTKNPVPTVGDNGVFDNANVLAVDDARYLAAMFDVTMGKSGVAGARGIGLPAEGSDVILASTIAAGVEGADKIYGLLTATAAYTPASGEEFGVVLECVR